MKITKNLAVCWFKDKRWDKMIYKVNSIRRFGRLGIVTNNKIKIKIKGN
mgnify:CR=1 FL=1|jgi:hypothetical protein